MIRDSRCLPARAGIEPWFRDEVARTGAWLTFSCCLLVWPAATRLALRRSWPPLKLRGWLQSGGTPRSTPGSSSTTRSKPNWLAAAAVVRGLDRNLGRLPLVSSGRPGTAAESATSSCVPCGSMQPGCRWTICARSNIDLDQWGEDPECSVPGAFHALRRNSVPISSATSAATATGCPRGAMNSLRNHLLALLGAVALSARAAPGWFRSAYRHAFFDEPESSALRAGVLQRRHQRGHHHVT